MLFRTLTFASLFVYLVSLAATQTTYGKPFFFVRWISLIALSAFCAIAFAIKDRRLELESLNIRVLIYLLLWGMTVISGAYPLFSSYRFISFALIVLSSLVFLPQIIRLTDAPRLLTVLKIIVTVTILASYLWPANLTYLDDPDFYRGIFGNTNALGHMAAVGCLLFLHGYLTNKRTTWGYVQLALMVGAGILLIRSGARSSTVAFLSGLFALFCVDRRQLSRNILIGWFLGFAVLVVVLALPGRFKGFILKHVTDEQGVALVDRLGSTRIPSIEASWEGFEERPLLGWGFGVDSDTDLSAWNGELNAVGFTGRDAVNDLASSLESGGVVGCFAYLFMLSIFTRLLVPPALLPRLKSGLRPAEYHIAASALEVQQILFCLSIMLIVLFEFDDTALSAGSFFAALLWVSLGLTVALRSLLIYELPQRMLAAVFASHEPALRTG